MFIRLSTTCLKGFEELQAMTTRVLLVYLRREEKKERKVRTVNSHLHQTGNANYSAEDSVYNIKELKLGLKGS